MAKDISTLYPRLKNKPEPWNKRHFQAVKNIYSLLPFLIVTFAENTNLKKN